jgi:sugar O-acyltransferase (sialic acid O-acetyltransferase NeuD family)
MKTVIFGSGQHGRVVLNILRLAGKTSCHYFMDDNPQLLHTQVMGELIIGNSTQLLELIQKYDLQAGIVAVGNPFLRIKIGNLMRQSGLILLNAIHPTAILDPGVKLGQGIVIDAGAILSPDPIIEDHVIINPGVSINHDNLIKEGAHLAAGVALGGDVVIGKRSLVGINAAVAPAIRIGDDCIIGVGAAVMRDVTDKAVMLGNPARLARRRTIDVSTLD